MWLYRLIVLINITLAGCSMLGEPAPVASTITNNSIQQAVPATREETHRARLAYIAEGNGRLFMCNIESTHLVNCMITGSTSESVPPSWLPDDVAFYSTANNINYAYVTSNASIFACGLANDSLVNCHTTGSGANQNHMEWLPTELKLVTESEVTWAFIAGVKNIYRCRIGNNGDLNDCAVTGTSDSGKVMNWLPNGITFNRLNTQDYAYIAASRQLYRCTLASNGDLINCHTTGIDSTTAKIHWHPNSTAFATQGSGFYAYIADPSYLYQCNVNESGELLNCNPTGLDSSGHYLHWLANNVAFNFTSDNKKYAYVVGVYNIYVCNVGENGAGNITNCTPTGLNPQSQLVEWNPNSIILRN